MEYCKVEAVDPNDPKMKDDVEVPSYASSSSDVYERNRDEDEIGEDPTLSRQESSQRDESDSRIM